VRDLSFTPIQNNRYNYSSLYVNLKVFREETGRQRTLKMIVAWSAAATFDALGGFCTDSKAFWRLLAEVSPRRPSSWPLWTVGIFIKVSE
jgi:hypothetical protein